MHREIASNHILMKRQNMQVHLWWIYILKLKSSY